MTRTFRIPVPVDGVYEGDVLGAFVWLKVPGLSGKVGVQVGDVEEMTPVPPAMPVKANGSALDRLYLMGDEDGGVTLHCTACPYDGGQGLAYYGHDTHPRISSFKPNQLGEFVQLATDHVAAHGRDER